MHNTRIFDKILRSQNNMSHYAVAVFYKQGQDISELLAKYDENLEVDPYIRYTKQEAIDRAKQYYDITGKTDEECWEMIADGYETDAEGNIYSTYNPNSKWDWWCVGGRFDDLLEIYGEPTSEGRVKDIKFPFDQKAYQRALRFWDVIVEGKEKKPGEDFFNIYKADYYREYYGDKETYARYAAQSIPYACVTPDGEWHAPGDMGWWAMSSDTPETWKDWNEHFMERFVDNADDDLYVAIVDCHI